VDGTAFLFRISMAKRGQAQTDVVGIFDEGYQTQSTDDLWSKLAKARSFRAYLANGEFKDAPGGIFGICGTLETMLR